MNALESLKYFLPESCLVIGAFLTLILDLFIRNKKSLGALSLIVLGLTGLLAYSSYSSTESLSLFFGTFTIDPFTRFFRYLALGVVALTILSSLHYRELPKSTEGEYYSLFLFITFGLITLGASTNLLMIYLAMEFVSILSYLLVGFLRKNVFAKEAAIKYLLFGSLASGMMLYGMSLLFGVSGSLDLETIRIALQNPDYQFVSLISLVLILAGLGFKISMAPFHMWAPDVYQAAPTPVTAFLTVGPKALGLAVLIRILFSAFYTIGWKWSVLITVLSILTMTLGNVIAIGQSNIKRLLAYSSIAQAGYILMGLAVFNQTGIQAVFIYLIAYAFTNLGAFIAVIIVSNHTQSDELLSYSGLARRSPFLAASLTIFLLSLAGIPPLAGFIGKFFVFAVAIEAKMITLALAAAVNSAIAAYYYFKVIRLMYLEPPLEINAQTFQHPYSLKLSIGITLAGTILMGLIPAPIIYYIQSLV